ncbi:CDP-diacylglycerol diphosphatase [Streptomyces sp. NPDC046805]|uniref:CDP-diacylglycerol diphosphatase n=1 Tax=Streptomyces sp. NPDC046805 TaxID=3155134 RepID=UPI003409D8E1
MSTENRGITPGGDPINDACGSPTDDGYLWKEIQKCVQQKPGPCLEVDSRWGVLPGESGSTTDFQLVATDRLKGIECPKIWASTAADYWSAALSRIPHYFPHPGAVGLGINSKHARRQDQLHIHMSHYATQALHDLDTHDKQQKIPTDLTKWKDAVLPVTGFKSETRNYRVMKSPNLTGNLFSFLRRYVVGDDNRMQYQTMIVLPRSTNGFYVLNSESDLHSGTDTCNHLLDCA